MSQRPGSSDLDRQISTTHRRFVKAMDARLDHMAPDTKERYFSILSMLVTKLEDPGKPLRDVGQEMMAEAMHLVLAELQG